MILLPPTGCRANLLVAAQAANLSLAMFGGDSFGGWQQLPSG
jgi:hypothetical protein